MTFDLEIPLRFISIVLLELLQCFCSGHNVVVVFLLLLACAQLSIFPSTFQLAKICCWRLLKSQLIRRPLICHIALFVPWLLWRWKYDSSIFIFGWKLARCAVVPCSCWFWKDCWKFSLQRLVELAICLSSFCIHGCCHISGSYVEVQFWYKKFGFFPIMGFLASHKHFQWCASVGTMIA